MQWHYTRVHFGIKRQSSMLAQLIMVTAIPEPPEDLATEALVFMISSLMGHFKHPIAYVLQDKCDAAVQGTIDKRLYWSFA